MADHAKERRRRRSISGVLVPDVTEVALAAPAEEAGADRSFNERRRSRRPSIGGVLVECLEDESWRRK